MKKRGFVIVEFVFEIIVGVLVFSALLSAGTQWGKGDIIKKQNIAKDLSLTIGLLQSSSYDSYIKYERDLSRYTIMVEGNYIRCCDVCIG